MTAEDHPGLVIAHRFASDTALSSAQSDCAVMLTRLADVKPERVAWLWPGRIPVGKLVTLDGDLGLGKSTLALSIAAVVTTGSVWPDGSVCEYPGAVLLMSAEDGWPTRCGRAPTPRAPT